MREVLNAIFYPARSGCAWRLLPPDFPAAVYGYFISWPKTALWQAVNEVLRSAAYTPEEQLLSTVRQLKPQKRLWMGLALMEPNSSLDAKASSGSMSWGCCLRSSSARAMCAGLEGTRHWLEQTPQEILGHLLLLWADDGFSGTDFSNWVDEHCGRLVEIVKLPDYAKGFVILLRRWLVEHTLVWLSGFRRL